MARRGDDVPALATDVEPGPEPPGAVGDLRAGGEEVQVPSARGLDPRRRRQRAAEPRLQRTQRVVTVVAVDIEDDQRAGADADVGVGPARPPGPRLLRPARPILQTVAGARVLARTRARRLAA